MVLRSRTDNGRPEIIDRPRRAAVSEVHPDAYKIDFLRFKTPVERTPVKRTAKKAVKDMEQTPTSKAAELLSAMVLKTPNDKRNNSRSRGGGVSDRNIEMEWDDDEKENVPPEGYEKRVTRSAKNLTSTVEDNKLKNSLRLEFDDGMDEHMESESPNRRIAKKSLFGATKVHNSSAVTPIRVKRSENGNHRISHTPKQKISMKFKMASSGYRVSNTPTRSRTPIRSSRRMMADQQIDESYDEDEDSYESDVDGESGSESESLLLRASKRKRKHISPIFTGRSNAATRPRTAQRKNGTLETILRRLHTSEVPENLPCREEEIMQVDKFIRQCITPKSLSNAMYISGVPGTGKTATVNTVINNLKRDRSVPDFIYVYVNAMELIDPKHLFINVYNEVTGNDKRISAMSARRKLNHMFDTIDKKRPPIVVLIDELDYMCTKRQELIYDLFNWTSCEGARINVIAIANTLDLPERMLCQKIASRLGTNRLCFHPYDFNQIEKIIQDRMSGSNAVDETAIKFASRKVAAISGDLRKAIDILRRAAEISLEGKSEKLTMDHVQMAIREASLTIRSEIINGLSRHKLTLFRAAVSQVQATGVDEFMFSEMFSHYCLLCTQLEGISPFNETIVRGMALDLSSSRLLVAAPGHNWWKRRFRLGMSVQEAQFALKHTDDDRKADGG